MKITFLLLISVFCSTVFAQSIWQQTTETNSLKAIKDRPIIPEKYSLFTLNKAELFKTFDAAPKEFTTAAITGTSNILLIPMPNGTQQQFKICTTPVMEAGLQQKFTEISTFSGQGIDDPYATIRIDFNPYFGFHAMILSVNGRVFVDPYSRKDIVHYISYYANDLKNDEPIYKEGKPIMSDRYKNYLQNQFGQGTSVSTAATACRGSMLYTYRLAVACTGEYAQAATGLANPTKAQTMAMITTTINRVVGVYEKEVAVRMVLVANNNVIVYTNPATDDFAGNDDANTLITESQTIIDTKIGNANYDIGHTFSTGGGGLAGLGVVCVTGQKASGITGRGFPVGDAYDIDYVCHEMGHQFGGNHTFNGADPTNCAPNSNPGPAAIGGTAYEVGSGTTIMGYAGICLLEDIQPNSDPFFHTVSFDEIGNYITLSTGFGCAARTPTGNLPPTITAMNNNNISIPTGTPFRLTGAATDPNGDALTYCWEQWDESPGTNTWNGGGATTTDPLFKSRLPKISGTRTFPDIRVIVANYPANPAATMDGLKGETLPTVPRAMRFRLTVRDNKNGGGGVATGGNGCSAGFAGTYTVNATGAPFTVSAPNGAETYACGSVQNITWNVGTSNITPINSTLVNIKLSTDGGLTYPTTILSNTANDGTQSVTIPSVPPTTTARIMVEAADNIFFDISNANFTITCNILAVSLLDFTVKPTNKNDAAIVWQTATETNHNKFILERSIGNTINFNAVYTINSLGTQSSGYNYLYSDNNLPFNTEIYYRLNQVAQNGTITYSEIKKVRFSQKGLYLHIQPNPAVDNISIVNDGETLKNAVVKIYAADGKLMYNKTTTLQTNNNSITISNFAKGLYTIQVITDKVLLTEKIVKQ